MTWLWILLAVFGVIGLLALICVARAVAIKAKAPATLAAKPDAARSERYAATLAKMIQCKTVSDIGEPTAESYRAFHALLKTLFPRVHTRADVIDFDGSLLFKLPGETDSSVVLMSHMDVVGPGGEWQHDPFGGEIEDGRIYGRGTIDTKGSLFAILQAAEELLGERETLPCTVYIASSRNEETTGEGAKAIADYMQREGIRPALLIDEGGIVLEQPLPFVDGAFAMLGVLEKGYAYLRFSTEGSSGHASVQQKNSPLARVGNYIHRMETRDPFKPELNETVREMFARMAPHMDFGMRFVFANLWLFGPLVTRLLGSINATGGAMIKTIYNFTTASGSDAINALPHLATLTMNMRISPHDGLQRALDTMRETSAQFGLDMHVEQSGECCRVVSHRSAEFNYVEQVIADVFPGVVPTPYVMTGGTDAHYFDGVCENLFRFAPIAATNDQLDGMHSTDENIYISSLPPAVDFYKGVIKNR